MTHYENKNYDFFSSHNESEAFRENNKHMVIHKKVVVLISFLRQNFYIPKFAARKHKQKAPGPSMLRIPAFLIGRSIGI